MLCEPSVSWDPYFSALPIACAISHVRPVCAELVGEGHGQRHAGSLPHLRPVHRDRHEAGLVDGDEDVGLEGRRDHLGGAGCEDASARHRRHQPEDAGGGQPAEEAPTRDDGTHRDPPWPAAWRMAARMRVYVPHRQMLPSIAASISASVGFGVSASSAAACMIWPVWQ